MIYAIVGRPRSGKSYESVVYHIIPAVKAGRKVITNVTLNIDWFVKLFGPEVKSLIQVVDGKLNEFGKLDRPFSKFEHYQDEWRDEQNRGPLYVIDEAHMVLPNRNLDAAILEFYSLHGHYGLDIILLTQNLRKVHRDIKDMIELTYYCAKNTAFGSDKTYTKKVRIGATTEVINEELRKYNSSYYPAYQSHTQSKGSVAEAMANDITPIWKRWPFLGAALFIPLGVFLFIFAFSGGDDVEPVSSEPVVKSQSSVPVTSVPDGQPSDKPKKKKSAGDFGPLNDFQMFVTGYSKQIAYSSRTRYTGELNRDLTFYRIYVAVYADQELRFTFDQTQLQDIGYTFSVLADCVYEVSWNDVSRILTCMDPEQKQEKQDSPLNAVPTFSL
ncbi:zonular occludens toxin domain-containing protein [Vibrio furnissii]|uniref:zonular occludens toxin domain-containing protein n=1 Tax=Vibrio furnissii TaxID=29494 RepID=UPI0025733047|nr:zonular occludens toxin domain-containing protein [Vibrio furnissii]WJG27585.1 zonular occludens toxin domain-containing protein [Vibrio furnissii]